MFRPRIIPVLLLKGKSLVKSVQFKNYNYIGDPINAVRLFNDLKADELVFLDIDASKEHRTIPIEIIKKIGEETNMPFAVGGGIGTIKDIKEILKAGAEKVIINSIAVKNPDFIREACDTFGSSTIAICIDVKKNILGNLKTWINNGKKCTGLNPVDHAILMEKSGAGEIIIQSITNDGIMKGYDIHLVKSISTSVSIPVIALGGAGNLNHLVQAYKEGFASGLAAGSMFVYQGKHKGVLINYPDTDEKSF
ncbi:MAG: imidazole glycerol phosphate synthase subunit HisF [Bacteroidetes bacterium HGW-Bacteroidetes-21]|jgi:cyclase|nr:MAG: imidazole glycerol phosphate synthase subunit HisF [Bacteroidetes bacterium HGW-Bacteroidetes-21]